MDCLLPQESQNYQTISEKQFILKLQRHDTEKKSNKLILKREESQNWNKSLSLLYFPYFVRVNLLNLKQEKIDRRARKKCHSLIF